MIGKPPDPMPESRDFAKDMLRLYPLFLATSWVVCTARPFSIEGALQSTAIVGAGLLSEFYGAAFLAWESLHLHKAKAKVAECKAYEVRLDQAKELSDRKDAAVNGRFLNEIGTARSVCRRVQEVAEAYEKVRYKMAIGGFCVLGLSALIQTIGTLS